LFALGDADGDGWDDLLESSSNSGTGSVRVEVSLGNGSFAPLEEYVVSSFATPSPPVLADFDGDGTKDLLTAAGNLVILLGRGGATYDYPPVLNAVDGAVSAADYDADGDLDLLRLRFIDDRVGLSSNDGSGSFGEVGSDVAVNNPNFAAAGDLDGDADLDVVVAHDTSVESLTNDGALQLALLATYAVGSTPVPALADFDLDGDLDLAVSSWDGGGRLYLYPGNGNGTFATRSVHPIGGQPRTLVASDWNADAAPDVAVQTQSPLQIVYRGGNGNGTFQAATVHAAAGRFLGPSSACDVDGDGQLDLVTTKEVLLGLGSGAFGAALAFGLDVEGVFDLSGGDGLPDLVRTSFGSLEVFSGAGDGSFPFSARRTYLLPSFGSGPFSPVLGDFDGDGDGDVVVTQSVIGTLHRGLRAP
jgi:hypothetical protein